MDKRPRRTNGHVIVADDGATLMLRCRHNAEHIWEAPARNGRSVIKAECPFAHTDLDGFALDNGEKEA